MLCFFWVILIPPLIQDTAGGVRKQQEAYYTRYGALHSRRERGRSVAGWHMRGVFIAEPSVAGFGRQLLNTVVEQVLKKAPAFPAEEHPATTERVPALPGGGIAARCRVGDSAKSFQDSWDVL